MLGEHDYMVRGHNYGGLIILNLSLLTLIVESGLDIITNIRPGVELW